MTSDTSSFERRTVLKTTAAGIGMLALPVSTAVADEYDVPETPYEVDLLAAQDIEVGTVYVDDDYITYDTTDSDWKIVDTHLHVAEELEEIPTNPAGNPQPGQFNCSGKPEDEPSEEVTYGGCYLVGFGDEDTVYIAAHAEVIEEGAEEVETAWGDGERFPEANNWATYFEGLVGFRNG